MSSSVDWSGLPPELLQTIAGKLPTTTDYIRFRAICQSWRSAVLITRPLLPLEFPWLMLPLTLSSDRRRFFNPLSGSLHRLSLPEASHGRRCAGSSFGWLVLVDESPLIFLVNPLSRRKITLPPLSSFPNVMRFDFYSVGREYTILTAQNDLYYLSLREMRDKFIKKVILSHNPYDGTNFTAFAILNRNENLAYCKNGDTSWRIIHEMRGYSEDVIYSNGKFYAVDKLGSLAIYNVTNVDSPKLDFIDVAQQLGGDIMYLVDAMGELLLVSRYVDFEIDIECYMEVCYTVKFQVFRFDWNVEKWEDIASLDDHVLFLGQNSSLALVASDYSGCTGDKIYFTDDYSQVNYDSCAEKCDMGVYSLADGSIEEFPVYPQSCQWPVWITPTVCF